MNGENETKKTTGLAGIMQIMSFTAEKAAELADANSVMGEVMEIDGFTVIPVSKISAGFVGGGASIVNAEQKKSQIPAGAGAKVTVTPMTFLVIGGGEVRAVAVDGSAEKKNGIVGAFCRVYDIHDAIEHFLPDTYEKYDDNRYTYKGGSTSGGLRIPITARTLQAESSVTPLISSVFTFTAIWTTTRVLAHRRTKCLRL